MQSFFQVLVAYVHRRTIQAYSFSGYNSIAAHRALFMQEKSHWSQRKINFKIPGALPLSRKIVFARTEDMYKTYVRDSTQHQFGSSAWSSALFLELNKVLKEITMKFFVAVLSCLFGASMAKESTVRLRGRLWIVYAKGIPCCSHTPFCYCCCCCCCCSRGCAVSYTHLTLPTIYSV